MLFLSSGTDSGVDERFRFELVGLARGEGCKHPRACTAAGIQQTETSAGGLVLRGAAASRQSQSAQSRALLTPAEMLVIERKRGSRALSIPRDAAA